MTESVDRPADQTALMTAETLNENAPAHRRGVGLFLRCCDDYAAICWAGTSGSIVLVSSVCAGAVEIGI
jgi:hypothetical protein